MTVPQRANREGMARLGGAEGAAAVLLGWLGFVELEVRGVRGLGDLEEGLRLLRGAVMAAAVGELHGRTAGAGSTTRGPGTWSGQPQLA